MEITSKEQAFKLIETSGEKMPYEAIKYLHDHETDEEIRQRIISSISNGYDWDNLTDDNINAALWYGIVAENHLDIRFVDAIITAFNSTKDDDLDFFNEQLLYLSCVLCEKFGDEAVGKFIDGIEKLLAAKRTMNFLGDTLYYADKDKHSERLLHILENSNNPDIAFLASDMAEAGFVEVLPKIKELLKHYKRTDGLLVYVMILEDAIDFIKNKDFPPPYSEDREAWEDHYKGLIKGNAPKYQRENIMEAVEQIFAENFESVHIGRNDPCHCGSGKKYKRCCMKK